MIYILYDFGAKKSLVSSLKKEKIFAEIGKLAYYGDSIDKLFIIELNLDNIKNNNENTDWWDYK